MPAKAQIPLLRIALQYGLNDQDSLSACLLFSKRLDEKHRTMLCNNKDIQNLRKFRHDSAKENIAFSPSNLVMLVLGSWVMKQHGKKFIPK